ncbi:MAG: UbiD family decarboxylase [Deltaproteobacteria bacterium]|nr:UbiD family decarboxylase [Deltaproteobacteria bacterium]
MPFNDIREFIARLEAEGEAIRIDEAVDWNLESSAMIRRANEAGLPSPFFQKVKDYPEGYTLFGEVLNNHRRISIAMDMDPDTHVKELIETYLARKKSPIKPEIVNDGPCKENICIGEDVDLLKFPVPFIHEGDGGRFIGTWHLTISKDPNSDWVNWGMHRHMLHDRNTIGIQGGPHTHVMRNRQAWEDKGKPMEIAIVLGVEPISTFCAASPLPYGVSEVDIAGGIRKEALKLVKCETIDLQVPDTSEIVIEGEIVPGETRAEGPFGEYTGYMGGAREPRYVIHVKAVTHRNNPILTTGSEGHPASSTHVSHSVTKSAEFLEILRAQGVPVTGVSGFIETATLLIVVAIKAGRARADDVAHAIWSSRLGVGTPWIIVVEDDVDPFDMGQVIHAVVSKCHPTRGIVQMDRTRTIALIPWLTKHEQKYLMGARAYFDCTWPPDWEPEDIPKKCDFDHIYPSDIREKALAKWAKYGY